MIFIEVSQCVDSNGRNHVKEWLDSFSDIPTRARIEIRISRMERGLFGDNRPVGEGVTELKLDFGPGYRVYFGREGSRVVILLCGGNKSSQQKDIKHAIELWKDYETRRK